MYDLFCSCGYRGLVIQMVNHRYDTSEQALNSISAVELRGMIPSAFGGIILLNILLHFDCKKQVSQTK